VTDTLATRWAREPPAWQLYGAGIVLQQKWATSSRHFWIMQTQPMWGATSQEKAENPRDE